MGGVMDEVKAGESTGRVRGDTAATTTTVLAAIGDKLGLFKDLAANGPSDSGELASRTGTNERYVREWLAGMFAAGYLTYDPDSRRYELPPEHAPTPVDQPGPAVFGRGPQGPLGASQRYRPTVGGVSPA